MKLFLKASGVSTRTIIQILLILLMIGGVELNPGPDNQSLLNLKAELAAIIRGEPQSEVRDRRDEKKLQRLVSPNRPNSVLNGNQSMIRRRRNSNEPGLMDKEKKETQHHYIWLGAIF